MFFHACRDDIYVTKTIIAIHLKWTMGFASIVFTVHPFFVIYVWAHYSLSNLEFHFEDFIEWVRDKLELKPEHHYASLEKKDIGKHCESHEKEEKLFVFGCQQENSVELWSTM